MESQPSDTLFKLCDDLIFLHDEFSYLAERIAPFGHCVDFLDNPPETLISLVRQISRSRERVKQTLQALNLERNIEIVSQIHRELTREYIVQASNAPLVVYRCLFRVVSHFDKIVDEADRVLSLLLALEELPAAQISADDSSSKSLSKHDLNQTSNDLCALMNIVIYSEETNSDRLTFQDEMRVYDDAIDLLKAYAAQEKSSGPISKVVFISNGDDSIAQTLKNKKKKLYKILKRREGAGAYFSTLRRDVWGEPDDTNECVQDDSIVRFINRLNSDTLTGFGYEIQCPTAEGERKAFLKKIERQQ